VGRRRGQADPLNLASYTTTAARASTRLQPQPCRCLEPRAKL
jgi:hypothetical protein